MISFLNSGFLFLASAVVIPVLIYLFAKKRPKRIIFSSIRFIKESQQQQKKRINLKNLLLLLIRMLIILLVILAISRPAIKSAKLNSGNHHPKTALALIVDNSYSMNYLIDTQTEFDKAKVIAGQIDEMLSADDTVILFSADADWNELHAIPHNGKSDIALIQNLEITSKAIPLNELLQEAENHLDKVHLPNREIILITDLQSFDLPKKCKYPTFIIPTSQTEQRFNISCQNSYIENELVQKGVERKINFELVNHASSPQQDVIYRLFLDDSTIAEKVTDLQPNQRKTESFTVSAETEGWHSGYVEVKNEREIFDNRNYFSFYHDAEVRIAVLTDLHELPLTLETMLEIYSGNSQNIQKISSDDLNLEILETFDNIIIYKKEFSNRLDFLLSELNRKKRGVLFIADSDLASAWQGYLAKNYNLQFKEFSHSASAVRLTFANRYHPITRDMKNIDNIRLNDFWQVHDESGAILKVGDSAIAIQERQDCVWLFDPASLQAPFLLDNAFPVFAYNALQFTSAAGYAIQAKTVSDVITAEQIVLPDGSSITPGNHRISTKQAGIYQIPGQFIPVNPDYSESEYTRLNDTKIPNLHILHQDWRNGILHSRYGYEIWKYLLIAVILLFIAEMLIIKKEERK
ncbi:MAG TPA: BatA domain-containing protein [Candidatus Cloacimonadota bacterium]|nr:BatA domain-containing protein [Candidatus Cloacimonadota bacterium]